MKTVKQCVSNLIRIDSFLKPYTGYYVKELTDYCDLFGQIKMKYHSLRRFADGYECMGLVKARDGWLFREWLPEADAVSLVGDFNHWDDTAAPLTNIGNGIWEVKLPGKKAIHHLDYYKLSVLKDGKRFERLPAYVKYTDMDPNTHKLCGRIWNPSKPFAWTDDSWCIPTEAPVIYEAHIGMSQEYEGIGSYREFADFNLKRIAENGYNTIQLMAIQEHPYYASFGYQVTNFFAPSFRFGTPDDLKYLINKAHGMGLRVLMDVVYAHSCDNDIESLYLQDGTDEQYFVPGEQGRHPLWGTKLFDFQNLNVLRFLLSNIRYWLKEFHFDGFRFDGVTSILYYHHGVNTSFNSYESYFNGNANEAGVHFLRLANQLIHTIRKDAITICEEVSGYPGACIPVESGGLGFDYRFAMGIPDYWIKLTKDVPYEQWDLNHLWYELTNNRNNEKSISYCECHDQSMVGDQTLLFRMLDAEMYDGMSKKHHSFRVDNGIAYIKLIKMITACTAKNGYLNFMGNEFGHPEWIDFPREGNHWSYKYARRQWSLAENPALKYYDLLTFDKALMKFIRDFSLFEETADCIRVDNTGKIVIFRRKECIFLLNFHVNMSQTDVFVRLPENVCSFYQVYMTTDEERFGGTGEVDMNYQYLPEGSGLEHGFKIYLPCKTGIVLQPVKE